MLTIDQLFTAPTSDQIRAQMVTTLVTLGVPADKWRSGGVASTILTAVAIAIAMLGTLMSTLIQGFFLPTATGGGLKLLAYYVYGVTVPDATFATGPATLTNTGGAVYTMGVGEYVALNSGTGQTYKNTTGFTLGALSSLSVQMVAVNPGSIANAVPGAIDTNVTALLGVTVTNPASLVGVDELTDVQIRTLCLNSLGARSVRGPRSAYAYAISTATNPVTGAAVNINRWTITPDSHTGVVTIYIASPSGVPDANDVIGVGNNIEAIARPDAVTVDLNPATAVAYTAAIVVYATAPTGTTEAQIQTAAANAVLLYLEDYPVGGVLAGDDTNLTLQGLFGVGVAGAIAEGLQAIGAKLISVSGASDLALSASQVATDSTTITARLITVSS